MTFMYILFSFKMFSYAICLLHGASGTFGIPVYRNSVITVVSIYIMPQ